VTDKKRLKKSMKTRRTLTMAAAALSLLGLSLPSHAVIIGTSDDYRFDWSYTVIGSDSLQHTLTGFGSLSARGFNSSSLTINVSLTNTSLLGGRGGERLTAFGFGIEPNATSVTFVDAADGGMNDAALGQNFPGFQGVDVCARGGSTCAGGSNGGIWAGGTDSFSIVLGGNWGSSVNIDPLALKYQTGYGSFEFSPPGNPPGGSVPEPGPLALFGLGLGVLALRRKRSAI
jgi:hypothetical protein